MIMNHLIHTGLLILFGVADVLAAERVAMSRGAGSFVAGTFVLPAPMAPLAEQGSLEKEATEERAGDAAGGKLEFGCEISSRAAEVIDFSFGEGRGIAFSFWELPSGESEVSGGAAEELKREIGGLSGVLTIRDLEAGVGGAGQSPSSPAAIAVPIGLVAAFGLTLRRSRGFYC